MAVIIGPIGVKAHTILAWHGYRDFSRVPDAILDEAHRVAEQVPALIDPAAACRRLQVLSAGDRAVMLDGGWRFTGTTVSRLLRRGTHAAVFVATIGARLEAQVSALFEQGEYLTSVLLDAAGTVALHRVVQAVRLGLVRDAGTLAASLTGRTSPGYGDWDLAEQAQLFRALGDPVPVRLTDSGMMLPKKSLSGVIGLSGGG